MAPDASRARLLILVGLALLTLGARTAGADTLRVALVVGANHGGSDDPPLRHAERDARAVADILTELGDFETRDTLLLVGSSARALPEALLGLRTRIRRFRAASPGNRVLLVVFYSGHADDDGLHIAGSRVAFRSLRRLVGGSGADLRVLILDACRSGHAIRAKGSARGRAKGAAQAKPFEILDDGGLAGEGTVVITSSAADEDAYESDELAASFFTHALVRGLRGAADESGDGRVTVSEAYRYAYEATLRATSDTRPQHPSYLLDIRGRADLVLTRVARDPGELGRLALREAGRYLIIAGDERGGITEVTVEAPTQLLLEPGDYVVRRRVDGEVFGARVRVAEARTASLSADAMRPIQLEARPRKGAGLEAGQEVGPRRWAVTAGGGVSSHDRFERPVYFVSAGVQAHWRRLLVEAGFRYGRHVIDYPGESSPAGTPDSPGAPPPPDDGSRFLEGWTESQDLWAVDTTALWTKSSSRLLLGAGLRLAVDRLSYVVSDLPERPWVQWEGSAGPVARADVRLGARSGVFVEGAAAWTAPILSDGIDASASAFHLSARLGARVGF